MPPKKTKDFNEHYFDVPTVENSYWAGFIATDGCINIEGFGRMCLCFSVTDYEAVKSLAQCLSSDIKTIKIYKVGKKHKSKKLDRYGRERYIISKKDRYYKTYTSNHMCGKLWSNFNITPQKTYTLLPPKLTDLEHIKAFLVGVIDGDGSIIKTEKKSLTVSLVSASKPFISWCNTQLAIVGGVKENKIYEEYNRYYNSTIYSLSYSCNTARKILKELVSVDVPKLERKWSKCQDL